MASERTPAEMTEAHRRTAIDFLIPKHHLDRKSERAHRERFIKDGETRVVGKQCGELAQLLADALASQSESHAAELAQAYASGWDARASATELEAQNALNPHLPVCTRCKVRNATGGDFEMCSWCGI